MTPTRTEIVLALLDDVLAEKYGATKYANLRLIERTAKRMADGIEQRDRQDVEHSGYEIGSGRA
jgi:hypothetical protein